jgi:hypothetical protein
MIALVECKEKTNVEKLIPPDNSIGGLKLISLLGFNDINTASMVIKGDSVFIIIADHSSTAKYYTMRSFGFDSVTKKFHWNGSISDRTSSEIDDFLATANHLPIYIASIGDPKLKYATIPTGIKMPDSLKQIVMEKTGVQIYKGNYYIIDRDFANSLTVYETATNKFHSFSLQEKVNHVTDFFLYDLDKDGSPEIFILHTGNVARDDVVSYSIFSLQKDSVKIN